MSKLSDGGVVTRTLASPQTELPIFGHRKDNRIHFALCNIGKISSPFQPICRCVLSEEDNQEWLVMTAKPHRHALMLFPFYILTALSLVGLAGFVLFNGLWVPAWACLFIAAGLIGIPYMRMVQGFDSDIEQLVRFLEEQGLNLEAEQRRQVT